MHKVIISDTSCLFLLHKVDCLYILEQLYDRVTITPEIMAEFGEVLPDWVDISHAKNSNTQHELEQQLDKAEASAIALALETSDVLLILDDLKARKIALKLGLAITGTIGIMVQAKLRGVIPSIKPILKTLSETNFRISDEIIAEAMRMANEKHEK